MIYREYFNLDIENKYFSKIGCTEVDLVNFENVTSIVLSHQMFDLYKEIDGGFMLFDRLLIPNIDIDWYISELYKLADIARRRFEIFDQMKNDEFDINDSEFFLNQMTPFSYNNRDSYCCFGITEENLGQIFGITIEPIDEYFDKSFPIIKLAENLDDFLQMLTKSD